MKAGDPEAEVTIFVWDEEEEDWVAVGNPFIVTRTEEDQTVKIKVVSHIEGQTDGELMAGQEMQEANGVTIVVTTYTDGTTSAVKVMK